MWRLILFILITVSACMEMKETVERMVMVRTTGSDLQPAATGFIYKRNSDGPVKVIKMEEDEILEQLKSLPETLYEQPKAFAAPIPIAAGPFYSKEQDENKAASYASEAYVIPVVEKSEEDDQVLGKVKTDVDGIADDEYEKILAKYALNFDQYNNKYGLLPTQAEHYVTDHDIEHGSGSNHGAEETSASGGEGHQDYASSKHYLKGGAGDYHTEKYESFSVSGGGDYKKDHDEADKYGSDYAKGYGYKDGNHGFKSGHSKGEETDGYHKLFSNDEFKKDHDFYDGEALDGSFKRFGFGKHYYGSDAEGFKKGGSHESGHDEAGYGKDSFHDQESLDEQHHAHSGGEGDESYHHSHGDGGSNSGFYSGKNFGFKVKHH